MSTHIFCDYCGSEVEGEPLDCDLGLCDGDFCDIDCSYKHQAGCRKADLERRGQGELIDIDYKTEARKPE